MVVFAVAGILESSSPGGMDEKSAVAIIIGFGIIGLLGLDLVAAGLGIAGMLQKHRKRLFALLGTIFSSAAIVCTLMLMIVGLIVRHG